MPLVAVRCVNGHDGERYLHSWESRYTTLTPMCWCGHPYLEQASYAIPLLYFSEKRPRMIVNLGATVRSHGEHRRVMRERGVEPATDWHVRRTP